MTRGEGDADSHVFQAAAAASAAAAPADVAAANDAAAAAVLLRSSLPLLAMVVCVFQRLPPALSWSRGLRPCLCGDSRPAAHEALACDDDDDVADD
jgi:hypothetical protein